MNEATPAAPRVVVANRRRGGRVGVVLRGLFVVMMSLGMAGPPAAFLLYAHYARDVDEATVRSFEDAAQSSVTRFNAADGLLVGEWFRERRLALEWEQLPRTLILAFLAAEDARFFAHDGIDPRGILRAFWQNIKSGGIAAGGSTITQQLAKTMVGSQRSYARKVREAILARRMEDLFSKERILTLYMNTIYLGHHSYGVQAAAQNYFHKDVAQLSLAESAMLAGLPQQPSRVNPVVDMKESRERMAYVLEQMERWGFITTAQREAALGEELTIHPRADLLGDYVPYYTEHVREDIEARYGREGDEKAWLDRGLTVWMAVEPAMQAIGRRSLTDELEDLAKKQGFPGPLGNLSRKRFMRRNARWLPPRPPEPGERYLARVTEAGAKSAKVELGEGIAGTLTLKGMRWAGKYTEYPKDGRGGYRKVKRVSFRPRLKKVSDALGEGDVVLVEVAGGEAGALKLELVPVPLMEGTLLSYPLAAGGLDTAVGGWDFDRSQVHRMTSVRQTGSVMKPIVYAKAYDLGLPPSALFSGAPFREGRYNPTGRRTKDDMTLWDALPKSENAVSLRVLQYVLNHTTKDDYAAWGRALGLPLPLKGNTSEVLGGDQTPAGMARAFGVFAGHGLEPQMHMIRKVVDRRGRVLERHVTPLDPHDDTGDTFVSLWDTAQHPRERRIGETTAFLATANMAEVVQRGTARRVRKLGHQAAGKTGTLAYDVWFAGYTPARVAVAWVGANSRERPLGLSERRNKVYGADTALPIWLSYMKQVDVGRETGRLLADAPPDVVMLRIDPKTGLLARNDGMLIPHRKGTGPKQATIEEISPENIGSVDTEF